MLLVAHFSAVGVQKNTLAVEGKMLVSGGVIQPKVVQKNEQVSGTHAWFRCKHLHVAALWDTPFNTVLFRNNLLAQLKKNNNDIAQSLQAAFGEVVSEIRGLVSVVDMNTRERYCINTYDSAFVYLVPKQLKVSDDRDFEVIHEDQYEIIVSKKLDGGFDLNCLVDKTKYIPCSHSEKIDKSELVLDSANYDEGQGLVQIIKNLYEMRCTDNQQVDDMLIIVRNLQNVVNEVVDVKLARDKKRKNSSKSVVQKRHSLPNSQSFLVLFFFLCCMYQISSVLG